MGEDSSERKALMREWVQSYAARSAVVHGASAEEIEKKIKTPLSQVVETTERNLRAAVQRWIRMRTAGDTIDWMDIVSR